MFSRLKSAARLSWAALDWSRRFVLNLLWLLLLLLVVAWLLRPGPPPLREKTTLVLDQVGS